MRKIFYLFIFLLTGFTMLAQAPGGVAGSVLWLKGNAGASAATWTDHSGSGNDFTSPPANQPVLTSNVFNFNTALAFNGTSTFMSQPVPTGFPSNNDNRTIFVVSNATATDGYRWIFVYGAPGSGVGNTYQVGNHDAGLINAFYAIDQTYNNYWNAAGNANGAMAAFTLAGGVANQYDRGTFLQTTIIGGLGAPSANGMIGALDQPVPHELWAGSIAEIILFPSALDDATRNRVEAYLAIKYGFTLGSPTSLIDYVSSGGTTYWTADAAWQNDVFGIGTDNGSALVQVQSNSMNSGNGDGSGQSGKGNLIVSAGTALADGQFLMIGNDAGALTEHQVATGEAPVAAEGSQRVLRNWKIQNTGTVGAVNLSFDITGLSSSGGTTASNYRLMIDEDGDGDYNSGTITYAIPASFTGNQLNFTGVTLGNNAVFTVLTQASPLLLPATWQDFTVTLQKDKATLVWKTSDEINVDHYTAEYSTDGSSFQVAGTVAAKNGAGVNTYSLIQENLPAGIRYYHIKRFDKDGRSAVSDVKSIRVDGLNTVLLKANPVTKGKLELNIEVQQNQHAVIRIVNTDGRILVQQHTGLSAGTNAVSANVTGLATGTYFLQVQLGTQIINKKFVRL